MKASEVVAFHDGAALPSRDAPWPPVEENHAANTQLWDEEDLARRRHAPDAEIVANKRAIDRLNQQRNDAAERIDEALLAQFAGSLRDEARLHSETPGMIIDRLSILALKIRAMGAQATRTDANASHLAACRDKLARLREQRADLARCLDELLGDCAAGRARFKAYRQFKMYNDPALNAHLKS